MDILKELMEAFKDKDTESLKGINLPHIPRSDVFYIKAHLETKGFSIGLYDLEKLLIEEKMINPTVDKRKKSKEKEATTDFGFKFVNE